MASEATPPTRITQKQAPALIARCEPFDAGKLTGGWEAGVFTIRSFGAVLARYEAPRRPGASGLWVVAFIDDASLATQRHESLVRQAVRSRLYQAPS
jgi:hypothetical protein